MPKFSKFVKDNIVIVIAVAVVVIFVAGVSAYNFYSKGGSSLFGSLSANAAGNKAVNYINDNYLKTTGKAVFESSTPDSTMYLVKFKVTMQGKTQEDSAYVTKDGKYLFPQMQGVPIDLTQNVVDNTASSSGTGNQVTSCDKVKKSSSPLVEAFIVSSCPYGLQMQRVLANVVQNIPAAKNNIKIEYIGSVSNGKITSMHGDEEAQENLRQICIRQEQPALYWNYVSCYMKKTAGTMSNGMPIGDSKGCLASTGVNSANLNSCMSDASRGLKYAQVDFDAANKYNVSGSPTLIVGGDTVSEFGFGGRTADALKSIICCASSTKPSFCSQTLSKDTANTSFAATYATAAAAGGSASPASNTNCAPAAQ